MTASTKSPAVWRRNLIGAGVAAAAAAVIVGTQLYPAWSDYRDTVVPQHVVPAGESLSVYGQTWRIGSTRQLSAMPKKSATQLPTHTKLYVVAIDRAGSALMRSCAKAVITDGSRRWHNESIGGFDLLPPEGVSDQCWGTGPMQLSFLLPDGAVPTAVDLTTSHGRILLRLAL
jgi:hypothetical protein